MDDIRRHLKSTALKGMALIFGLILASLYWAQGASLTTSFTVGGQLASEVAAIPIQAERSGKVVEILSENYDQVTPGQVLLRLDTTRESRELSNINDRLKSHLREIEAIASTRSEGAGHDQKIMPVRASYGASLERASELAHRASQRMQFVSEKEEAASILASLEVQLSLERQHLDLAIEDEAQAQKLLALGQKTFSQHRAVQSRLIATKLRYENLFGEIKRLKGAQARAQLRLATLNADWARMDESRIQNLKKEIGVLEMRRDVMRAEIEKGLVRADRVGKIINWEILGTNQVVELGQAIGQIIPPVAQFHVALEIDPQNIDQVHLGQIGVLRLSSLSARQYHEIEIEITEISPIAARSHTDAALSYPAVAQFTQLGRAQLQSLSEASHLSLDMPITVQMEGEAVTPLSFFLSPIEGFFKRGLQD